MGNPKRFVAVAATVLVVGLFAGCSTQDDDCSYAIRAADLAEVGDTDAARATLSKIGTVDDPDLAGSLPVLVTALDGDTTLDKGLAAVRGACG